MFTWIVYIPGGKASCLLLRVHVGTNGTQPYSLSALLAQFVYGTISESSVFFRPCTFDGFPSRREQPRAAWAIARRETGDRKISTIMGLLRIGILPVFDFLTESVCCGYLRITRNLGN